MKLDLRGAYAAVTAAVLSSTLTAPDASADDGLPEIVVTAQQRSQNLQDVPIAVSALSGEFLTDHQLNNFSDLALFTPGFVSAPDYGYIRNSSIRGISNNQFGFADDPSIAMFVDGVYQGRGGTGSQVNALYDIDHVEVIKGPQATLFGRSSIAGAISTLTNQPSDHFELSGDFGFGERDRVLVRGVANLPITTDLAVRFAGDIENENGYIRNLAGGPDQQPQDIRAARINVQYKGIEGVIASLKMDYELRKQGGNIYQAVGLPDFTTDSTLIGNESYADFNIFDTVGTIKATFSPSLSLTSQTSWRRVKNQYAEDYDAEAAVIGGPYTQQSDDRLFQQDLRLNYEAEDHLSFVAGASYFHENLNAAVQNWVDGNPSFTGFAFTGVPTPGLLPGDYSDAFQETGTLNGTFHGYSAFLDGSLPIVEHVWFEAGVRYNSDSKDYTQDIPNPADVAINAGKDFAGAYYNWGYFTSTPIESSHTWTNTSGRAALNWAITPDTTAYLSWSQGWKAGGIDSFKVQFPNNVVPPGFNLFFGEDAAAVGGKPAVYNPEKSDSYELGLKGKALERRFRYTLAVYDFEYKDLQTSVAQGGSSIIENVGKAEGRGAEAEARLAPGGGWDLFANGAYNFTKITEFAQLPSQVGLPLNRAPKTMGSGGVSYTMSAPGAEGSSLIYEVTVNYRGAFRTDNALVEGVDSYVLTNLRVGYQSPAKKFSASVFADNVFDRFNYNRYEQATPFLFPVSSYSDLGYPRTVGVDFHTAW